MYKMSLKIKEVEKGNNRATLDLEEIDMLLSLIIGELETKDILI